MRSAHQLHIRTRPQRYRSERKVQPSRRAQGLREDAQLLLNRHRMALDLHIPDRRDIPLD